MVRPLRVLATGDREEVLRSACAALATGGFAPVVGPADGGPDLILATWGDATAGLLAALGERHPGVPAIVVAPRADETTVVEAIRAGAVDVVASLARLPAAAERALREAAARRDRRRAEELEARERRFLEEVLGAAPGVVFRIPSDPREPAWVSPSARSLVGHPPEHLVVRGQLLAAIHPEDRGRVAATIDEVKCQRTPRSCEYRIQHGETGAWVDLLVAYRAELAPDGRLAAVVGFAVDVTARRAAEERARELAAIVESAEDAAITLDAAGLVRTFNPAAERLYGWTAAEVIGRPPPTFSDADGGELIALFGRVLAGEHLRGIEGERPRKDGTRVPVGLSASPLRGPDGRVRGVAAILRDLSERRALERQLQEAQTLETVARLAGSVAHDFNNLLAAMRAAAEFLVRDLELADPRRADALEIRAATGRAAALTRQLLAFSRRQERQPDLVDLDTVVDEVAGMLRRLVGESWPLVVRHAGALPPVVADRGQLEQVLSNLVVNARDAMPGGGPIEIETRCEPGGTGGPPAGWAVFTVRDRGTGIPLQVRDRIFEPFVTTKPPGKGTGLGLSAVYGIVRQSGGTVEFDGLPGVGTAFHVRLPGVEGVAGTVAAPPAPVPDPPADPPARVPAPAAATARAGGARILLVDDEAAIRSLADRILRAEGHDVRVARSGEEALALAAAEPVDLLVSDVVMPGLSGPAVARRLLERQPDLPVVFCSGYPADEGLARLLAGGALFLPKPFAPEALAGAVRRALGRPEPR